MLVISDGGNKSLNPIQTVRISRELVALHERYAPEIIRACQRSVAEGAPVNAPIWWIAPDDTTAHAGMVIRITVSL